MLRRTGGRRLVSGKSLIVEVKKIKGKFGEQLVLLLDNYLLQNSLIVLSITSCVSSYGLESILVLNVRARDARIICSPVPVHAP